MRKAIITVVMATIGLLAIVLTATVMLIDASAVSTTALRDHRVPSRCRAQSSGTIDVGSRRDADPGILGGLRREDYLQ